jgi:ATP phosphoribosyltransferase regulatory subunit
MGRQGVNRLCYAGSTLKTIANAIPADRSPVQLGAEIFGCGGIEADIEVVDLLLSLVCRSGLSDITFDIGHVAFCELVMAHVGLSTEQQNTVLELLARKANSDLDRLLATFSSEQAEKISVLATMHGGIEVLDRARAEFADISGLDAVIGEVEAVLVCCQRLEGRVNVYVDMTEAHGYRYHSGAVFALYAKELGAPVAKGGRYDGVGEVFGRRRPATGFAIDLKAWSALATLEPAPKTYVASPVDASAQLAAKESELRASGVIVIKAAGGEVDDRCTQQLVKRNNEWLVEPLEKQ